MARRKRVEVEGGLYHVITRVVGRQDIFHDEQDFAKFLSLLADQKLKLPFYLYAYCLMTNHIHLLIRRQAYSDLKVPRDEAPKKFSSKGLSQNPGFTVPKSEKYWRWQGYFGRLACIVA